MKQNNLPTPTIEQFNAMQNAYGYFNKVLFGGELPSVILNLSRKSKACGFVAPFRWRKADAEPGSKGTIHELSINPEILCMDAIEVYSTLVHEQCHIWQHEYGEPTRSGYHNKEWAAKMQSVGLIPSNTGKPGGAMTGQNMSDYPPEGGRFLQALERLPQQYKLPFVSIEGDYLRQVKNGHSVEDGEATPNAIGQEKQKRNKVKYTCPDCQANVWGKPQLKIRCGECNREFEPAGVHIY